MNGVRPSFMLHRLLWALLLSGLSADLSVSQVQKMSPSDLVRFLTYQGDRPGKSDLPFASGCAVTEATRADLAAVQSLIEAGAQALPPIERELEAVERGEYLPNAGRLVYAYSKIRGPRAFSLLWRLSGNPRADSLMSALDDSLASTLSLTAYVSSNRLPGRVFYCGRSPQPADALSQLVLAWEKNDLPLVKASLGPNGTAALKTRLEHQTWEHMRREFWPSAGNKHVAIGYRFETTDSQLAPVDPPEIAFAIQTLFTDKSGANCATRCVHFIRVKPIDYLVDDSDLIDLLRLIGSCAAR